jgi:chromosomal replication initiator protein
MTPSTIAEPSIAAIQQAVCEEFRLSLPTMLSGVRAAYASHPRQVAIWLSAKLTSRSVRVICQAFGRDRSTVFHAIGAVEQHIHQADSCGAAALSLYRRLSPLSPHAGYSVGGDKCVDGTSSLRMQAGQ